MSRHFHKQIIMGFCLLAACTRIVCADWLGPYQVLKTETPISVDGKLDEPVWQKAGVIHFKDIATGESPALESEARLAWDDQYFYAAMTFKDPNVWGTVDIAKPGKWRDMQHPRGEYEMMYWDCFAKFFFDPDADGRNYLEFHINPLNSMFDAFIAKGMDSLYRPLRTGCCGVGYTVNVEWKSRGVLHAVHVDGTLNDFSDADKGWSVELAILWEDIQTFIRENCPPKNGDIWKSHLGWVWRKGPGGDRHYWTWPVMGIIACHTPDKWETIQFVDPNASQSAEKIWRGGWAGKEKDPQTLVDTAKKLGFSALIIHASDDFNYLNDLCLMAGKSGIDVYYWFHIIGNQKNKDWWQVVTPGEAEKAKRIKEDGSPGKHGYQSGGEPVNDETDVHTGEFLCFHRPEVMEHCRQKLEKVLRECPGLAGIAFDYFGYKNYRGCHCPVSEKMFEDYYRRWFVRCGLDGKVARDDAFAQFSLDTLVDFNNRLAEYCRQIKPGVKIGTHIYPAFIANPVYGNRLDVDYCMQTVAWFFEPFWNSGKIEKYTAIVLQDAKRYFASCHGIPFVGIYLDNKDPKMNKPVERFRKELQIIRKHTQSFSVCPFNVFIDHPELGDIFIREMGLPDDNQ
ncbi:MAG: carbohydrate-binding family 9-like protein [Kiritimatiellae bacterium]|nr:carbohydrate-binding family 9-like protein [Kiritimatiellia bacterium]